MQSDIKSHKTMKYSVMYKFGISSKFLYSKLSEKDQCSHSARILSMDTQNILHLREKLVCWLSTNVAKGQLDYSLSI